MTEWTATFLLLGVVIALGAATFTFGVWLDHWTTTYVARMEERYRARREEDRDGP